jgi:hypothetical protein
MPFFTLILSEPPPTKPGMAGDERERVSGSGRDDERDERIFLKARTLQTTLFLCTQSPRRINLGAEWAYSTCPCCIVSVLEG